MKFIVLLSGLLLASAVSAAPRIKHPDLSDFSGPVRDALSQAREGLDAARAGKDRGAQALAYAELGMVYHAHELPRPATQAYANATELSRADFRWRYLAAAALNEAGDAKAAERELVQALVLNDAYAPARIRLGRLRLRLGDPEGAKDAVAPILSKSPDNAAALGVRGEAELALEEWEAAEASLMGAFQIQPRATRLLQPLAMALRNNGKVEEAKGALAAAGDGTPLFDDPVFSEMLGRSASYTRYLGAGRAAMAAGDGPRALAYFRRALELQPENASVLINLAEALSGAGRFAEAAGHLDKALAIDPAEAAGSYGRGLLYERAGDQASADSYYRRAVELRADFVEPRILLANSLMRAGRYAPAVVALDEVLALQPDNADMRFRRAMAKAQVDCESGARVLFELTGDFPDALNLLEAYARTVAGCAATTPEEKSDALEMSQQLYAASGGASIAATRALAEAANGNFKEAETYQSEVMFDAVRSNNQNQVDHAKSWLTAFRESRLPADIWPPAHPYVSPALVGGRQ